MGTWTRQVGTFPLLWLSREAEPRPFPHKAFSLFPSSESISPCSTNSVSFQKSCRAADFISPLTGICGVAAGCPGWGSRGSQRPGLLPRAHRPGGSAALLMGTFVSLNGLTHLLTHVFFQVRLQKDCSAAASLRRFRDDSH